MIKFAIRLIILQMKSTIIPAAIVVIAMSNSCRSRQLTYPQPPVDSSVEDVYFNIKVADPYRPLEDDTAAATVAWTRAENALTQQYLSQIPFREAIKKRLTELNDYRKTGLPWRDNDGRYYVYENDGLQPQSVLYRSESLDGQRSVFLDPNKLDANGTLALKGTMQSPDGKLTAYTVSRNGSDWIEIYVMDTETGQLLPDHIEWAKFTGVEWDGSGFYYSAYPRPEAGKEFANINESHNIYYHRLGTPQSDDRLIYTDHVHPLHFHQVWVPEGSDYIFVIGAGEGFGESLTFRKTSDSADQWTVIEPSQDYEISPVALVEDSLYVVTTYGAERYRLMAIDLKGNPTREAWTEVIPQQEGILTGVQRAGADHLLVSMSRDASDHIYLYTLGGKLVREIALPTFGTVSAWSSKHYPDIFYAFTSFTFPSAKYFYDMATDTSTEISKPEIKGVDFSDYVTEQVRYTSADGTEIPMYITYKKGTKLDGKNPTLLYGYGGFNISLPPSFSANRMLWLENGGVYAQANLRGGGEYGQAWHHAGTKMQKLNVFNDFIAAAQYLIAKGYTNPDMLAIQGGSNGGLLVGAVTNMRPDLFRVAIPQVGVMDMMRYHKFTIGWNWASDYGISADSPEMAQYLLDYSPIHNIRTGVDYPAILVTTADHDDRVVPAHSFKYAATLQATPTGPRPKLIRIDANAGHGAGKPTSKMIDEYTDIFSFIFYNLGIEPHAER